MSSIFSEIRWLRNNSRRFFTVDEEAYTLFEVNKGYKWGTGQGQDRELPRKSDLADKDLHKDDMPNMVPFKKLFELKFESDEKPRSVALSHLQDSVVALSFNNKIMFHRANADPSKVPDDVMGLNKVPLCIDWSACDKYKFLVISERKSRSAFTIYDLERASNTGYDYAPRPLHWPVREKLCAGAFFPEDKELVALVSKDYIRIVDIRGRERHATAVMEPPPYGRPFVGLQVEPNIGYRFLAYRCDPRDTDNEIYIYDRRYLRKPIYQHQNYTHKKARIRRCVWNPHRRFSFNCLTVDANKIYDFSISGNAFDYGGAFTQGHKQDEIIENVIDESRKAYHYSYTPICFPDIHNIRTFDWHPKHENEIAIVVNQPQHDLRHIQLFSINPNANAVLGVNNECAYSFRQYGCVSELVVAEPVTAHKVRFLEYNKTKPEPPLATPKVEVLPYQYSDGMYFVEQQHKVHNDQNCREEHCVDCLRRKMNTRRDESERRNIEDNFYKLYWASVNAEAQRQMHKSVQALEEVLKGDDVSVMIRQRVELGYGYGQSRDPHASMIINCQTALKADPKLSTPQLTWVWQWIENMNYINAKYDIKTIMNVDYGGIDELSRQVETQSSQFEEAEWGSSRVFTNKTRQQMLAMTMWPEFSDKEKLKKVCDQIASEYSTGALIRSVFLALAACQGSLAKEYFRRLIEAITQRDASLKFDYGGSNFIALALKTYKIIESFNGANLRKEDYHKACEDLKEEPLLLACVKFISRRLNYTTIMSEIAQISALNLEDRVMFCLINMDDRHLCRTFTQLHAEMLAKEPLKALMFTGLYDCDKTHKAILRYYDNTHDIQTCSILYMLGNCFGSVSALRAPNNIGLRMDKLAKKLAYSVTNNNHKRGLNCFFDYLQLLSAWDMNMERTFLYNQLFSKSSRSKSSITRAQAVIACNFCNRAAYPCNSDSIKNHKAAVRGREIPDNFPNRARITTCAYCRKPLPKCIICRHHYGSIVDSVVTFGEQDNSIDHSFVFCVHCHHGGHYTHLQDWFKDYDICPATGCECRCGKRDGALLDQQVKLQGDKMITDQMNRARSRAKQMGATSRRRS